MKINISNKKKSNYKTIKILKPLILKSETEKISDFEEEVYNNPISEFHLSDFPENLNDKEKIASNIQCRDICFLNPRFSEEIDKDTHEILYSKRIYNYGPRFTKDYWYNFTTIPNKFDSKDPKRIETLIKYLKCKCLHRQDWFNWVHAILQWYDKVIAYKRSKIEPATDDRLKRFFQQEINFLQEERLVFEIKANTVITDRLNHPQFTEDFLKTLKDPYKPLEEWHGHIHPDVFCPLEPEINRFCNDSLASPSKIYKCNLAKTAILSRCRNRALPQLPAPPSEKIKGLKPFPEPYKALPQSPQPAIKAIGKYFDPYLEGGKTPEQIKRQKEFRKRKVIGRKTVIID